MLSVLTFPCGVNFVIYRVKSKNLHRERFNRDQRIFSCEHEEKCGKSATEV